MDGWLVGALVAALVLLAAHDVLLYVTRRRLQQALDRAGVKHD